MKKILMLFVAASVSGQATTVHDGLLAYWNLDGDGLDTAGSLTGDASMEDDDLVVEGAVGTTTINSTGGLFGGAVDFERSEGTDGRLAAADSVDLDATGEDITISFWTPSDLLSQGRKT